VNEAEVVELWRQAGLPEYCIGNGGTNARLCDFARLIAAAERERCAKVCDEVAHRAEGRAAGPPHLLAVTCGKMIRAANAEVSGPNGPHERTT
jgi:hypothetical protein